MNATERLLLIQCFQQSFNRTAVETNARSGDLRELPLLFGQGSGFDKRMQDALNGKKERLNFPGRLRQYVRSHFSEYRYDPSEKIHISFRKSLKPGLDLLLIFERIHNWGLGKSFTVVVGADFPNTHFARLHHLVEGTRSNIFALFHQGWETQVWTYTTSKELDVALESCAGLLNRILPICERNVVDMLYPLPVRLPQEIRQLGALTAREAHNIAATMSQDWVNDATLQSLECVPILAVRDELGPGIDFNGRLLPHGRWLVKMQSQEKSQLCLYSVPFVGDVGWNYYPVSANVLPRFRPVIDVDDWIDSREVTPVFKKAADEQLGDFRIWEFLLSLGQYEGNIVWQGHFIATKERGPNRQRRDVIVRADRTSGQIINLDVR